MKKRSLCIIICLLLFGNCILSCLLTVPVLGLSLGGLQSTIASIIISLMLECGAAPVNNSWLQTLNTSYGVTSSIGTIQDCIESGLLTQTATGLVDTGLSAAIESAPAYTELGLSEIFTTSADDVVNGVVAGSGAVNLCNTAINVGTVGTIGAFAGAAAIGVGLGVLANHLYNKWQDSMKYGIPVYDVAGMQNAYSDYMFEGGKFLVYNTNPTSKYPGFYSFPYRTATCAVLSNTNLDVYYRNLDNVRKNWYFNNYSSNSQREPIEYSLYANETQRFRSNGRFQINGIDKFFNNDTDARSYLASIDPDTYEVENYSPDIIGRNGNHSSNYNPDSGYVYDNRNPVVPDGYDMNPVDMDDYQDYADNANENTRNGDVNQPIQGEEFDNLIDSLIFEPSIIPDQGVTDPEVPDRPIIPDQPVVPGKDPITGEQQSQVLEGITTPDLRSVFPFCIPFDLYALLGNLKYESREAPVIVWEFEFLGNNYPIIIDLSPYDEAAEILRLLELLLFIIGLAVNTRKLIGAGG